MLTYQAIHIQIVMILILGVLNRSNKTALSSSSCKVKDYVKCLNLISSAKTRQVNLLDYSGKKLQITIFSICFFLFFFFFFRKTVWYWLGRIGLSVQYICSVPSLLSNVLVFIKIVCTNTCFLYDYVAFKYLYRYYLLKYTLNLSCQFSIEYVGL